MNPRTILIAVLALTIAGGTGFAIQSWMKAQRASLLAQQPKEKPETDGPQVLVARATLPAGTLLNREHVEWRAWPAKGVSKAYVVKGKRKIEDFINAVVRKGIAAGEPITEGRVAKPGERGFMAAVLTPGMRAVSVRVDATSGIAGFVFPGDRIDLILTHKVKVAKAGRAAIRRVSETVLTGVRVLAVDQSTNDVDGKPKIAKTATLEVTAKQVELVAVAAQLGKLSLSLQSLPSGGSKGHAKASQSGPARRGHSVTRDYEVSRVINSEGDQGRSVSVLRGSSAGKR